MVVCEKKLNKPQPLESYTLVKVKHAKSCFNAASATLEKLTCKVK